MKLSTSLVPVRRITSNKPRSNFSDDELEKAAQLILETEGVINPIVVRRTSLQSYEVVDGDFEYYAAARAREIDLSKGEMIGAFIIEPENEEALTKQVQLFRKLNIPIPPVEDVSESRLINIESRTTSIESRITNQELRSEKRTDELGEELKREIKNINTRLNELESRLPKPIEPLEALNKLKLPELILKLSKVSVKRSIIENIFNEREANGKYSSFTNVIERIKGLGEKTMIKIIDSFSESTV